MEGDREKQSVRDEIPTQPVSDDIWKLILDRSKIPENLIHIMRGDVFITRTGKDGRIVGDWEQMGEPLMNEKGIRFFTSFFYSAMTPDKLTTNISEDEVRVMMEEMIHSIIEVIEQRGNDFEIHASNRTFVLLQIEHFYFMALSASRKGTILAALKPSFKRDETYVQQKPQKQPGLLQSITPTFLGGGKN